MGNDQENERQVANKQGEKHNIELKTDGYRLNKISPLFLFIEAVKKMIIPLLFGFVNPSDNFQELIFYGVAILASVFTIVQFWFYHYWLEEERLVVKEGIFFKSLRQVPYERIQNLNIERNLLHKFFKVGTLQVESASGAKPEAVIRVVSEVQIKYIQDVIKTRSENSRKSNVLSEVQESGSSVDETSPMYKMNNRDVVTYGFISYQGLWILGVVGYFLSQNQDVLKRFVDVVKNIVSELHVERWAFAEWLIYGLAFGFLMLITIWTCSILLAFLKLYQFRLARQDNSLHAEMGLLTKITANIPIKRIQLLKIKDSPLHRYFRKVSVKMETAGGVTEQSGISMKWIAPLISKVKAQKLITAIQPEVDWKAIEWLNLEPRAWKRVFKRVSLLILIIMAPLHYFYEAWGLLMLLFFPLAFMYAKAYVSKAGYAANEEIIAYRHGVIFHTISVVKVGKIQNITYVQTPFDRRNNMARITVDTAGSNIASKDINIHYLDVDKVHGLMSRLSSQVSQSKFVW